MDILGYFNATIGSCLIIILIAADYLRKYNVDNFQRKALLLVLSSIFLAALSEYIGMIMERTQGGHVNTSLYFVWSINMIARNCSFYYAALLVDYTVHENAERSKKLLKIITVIMIAYGISVIPNINFRYYFAITRENVFIPGTFYLLHLLIGCLIGLRF